MNLPLYQPHTVAQPNEMEPSKARVQQRFDKASKSYTAHNELQAEVSTQLLDMMAQDLAGQQTGLLLDLGCGPGVNSARLSLHAKTYLGMDISSAMLDRCREVALHCIDDAQVQLMQADMDSLPLAKASADVIFSSLAVQWSQDKPALLSALADTLKPSGSGFISTLLSGSLEPLARLRREIDGQAQVNSQASILEWRSWLSKQPDLEVVSMVQCRITVYSADLNALLHGIKGVGAGANQAAPLTRSILRTLDKAYKSYRSEQGLPLHYEVLFLHIKRR